jgi:hypothetical protein
MAVQARGSSLKAGLTALVRGTFTVWGQASSIPHFLYYNR